MKMEKVTLTLTKENEMADPVDPTVTMTLTVLNKLIALNSEAVAAVSLVGGNSIQDSYREDTKKVLAQQKTLMEVFIPSP